MQIDHVVLAVKDLDEASAVLDAQYGLTALAGRRHPAWGLPTASSRSVTPTSSSDCG